jgi:hypothetical protein
MLLIRSKKFPIVKNRRVIKTSSVTIVSRIEMLIAIPFVLIVIWFTDMSLKDTLEFVLHHVHYLIPILFIIVWVGKALFNIGQKVEEN